MATHDYVIANGTGAAVRSDLNNALAAIVSNNSGSSEPGTTYAYQWWADTNANVLKIRNSANDGWITLRELDGTMLIEDGSASTPGLAFADDVNTGIFSGGADEIALATGGAERLEIGSSEVVFNDPSNDVDFRVESNGNTHMLFVDAGNDVVGIGESSPAAGLDVKVDTNPVLAIDRGSANAANFNLQYNGTLTGQISAANADFQISAVGASTPISFYANGSERARIDSAGNVSIGTDSPNNKLTVATGTANTGIANFTGATPGRGLVIGTSNDGGVGDDTVVFNATQATGAHAFEVGGSEKARITSNGLTFNGDTAAANALDDYEEGTFTVTYVPASGSFTAATYAEQNGSYTKIGNRVFFNLRIRTSGLTKGSASGDLDISGLPYDVINDATNGRNAIAISIANEWAGDVPSGGHCEVNSDDIALLYRDASDGAALAVTVDDMGTALNKNQLWITGSYRVS